MEFYYDNCLELFWTPSRAPSRTLCRTPSRTLSRRGSEKGAFSLYDLFTKLIFLVRSGSCQLWPLFGTGILTLARVEGSGELRPLPSPPAGGGGELGPSPSPPGGVLGTRNCIIYIYIYEHITLAVWSFPANGILLFGASASIAGTHNESCCKLKCHANSIANFLALNQKKQKIQNICK